MLSTCLFCVLLGVVSLPFLRTAPAQLFCVLCVCVSLFFVLTAVGFELLPLLFLMALVGAVLVLFLFAIAVAEHSPARAVQKTALDPLAEPFSLAVFVFACVKAVVFASFLSLPTYRGVGLLLPAEELASLAPLYQPNGYLSLVVFLGFLLTLILWSGTVLFFKHEPTDVK